MTSPGTSRDSISARRCCTASEISRHCPSGYRFPCLVGHADCNSASTDPRNHQKNFSNGGNAGNRYAAVSPACCCANTALGSFGNHPASLATQPLTAFTPCFFVQLNLLHHHPAIPRF